MTGLPGELVADHLHIDLLAHVVPYCTHEILVDPWFKLAHPVSDVSLRFMRIDSE